MGSGMEDHLELKPGTPEACKEFHVHVRIVGSSILKVKDLNLLPRMGEGTGPVVNTGSKMAQTQGNQTDQGRVGYPN